MAKGIKTKAKNAVSALCIALISAQPVLAQSIVSDGNGPVVTETANGTTMVMINTPDANGVSHNTFVEFGVGADGAILNNLDGNDTPISTQIGGIMQGNGNLTGGSASIIINEVTTDNPSILNGYLEVGGQRADVIVANPYGITCDGCGFINTDRLTMTTGTPIFDGGNFTGLSVNDGAIDILGGGLDASDSTRFDLISRQISVAGAVQGQRIRVIAGRNDVIYATGEITEKADDGSEKPELAIDSTVLGGMFADAITITSTEDGVGVRAPNNMAANAGGMTITADGRLVMRSASATENTTIESTADVVIEDTVVSQQNINITTPEDLILTANAALVADSAAIFDIGNNLTVGTNAEMTATRFDLNVAGAFAIGNDADVVSVETLDVDADSLMNFGTLASTGGQFLVTTSLDLTNEGLMFGDTAVVLRSDASIYNNGGSIIANGDVAIRGDDNALATAFTNQFGGVVETITGDISIAAVSFGNLREAPLVDGALVQETGANADDEGCTGDTCFDPITVGGQITQVGEAAQIISAGNITLTGTDVTNAYSLISAGGNININVDTLENIGLNAYRDTGGALEFVGAVFGTIEARGNINGTVGGYVNNGAFANNTAIINGPSNTDTSDISIESLGNADLLIESQDPDSEFLVETRPEFVDLDQFISSDYFLEAIEYDPELRRFGDAYAEALYIRKQLQALLGQLILTVGVDERAQIKAMYDNAIDAQANLDLTPGVALTPDQIGALTSDIVWLEETEINGEIVLAPRVYLANPEIRLAGLSGAIISGQNVNFRTDNFSNAGNITATDTISIVVSDTFRSTGGTVSAENIAVVGNNIEIVTDARRVVTEQGIRLVKLPIPNPLLKRLFADASWTDQEDRALQTATFMAGSTLVLTARDAITTAGAQISAGDNITLLAGGDITIGALALASETGNTSGSNRNRIERFDHLTTSLSAGGDITILSSGNVPGQNDIVLEGANVTAGGNVGLIAQDGDLILASVADVYYRDYARKSGNFFRKKVRRSQTLNVTNQTTSITGASITGVAANNILVEGGRFDIPGVANSDVAPGQLSLVSVNGSSAFTAPTDVRASSSYKSTAYLGGLITNSRDKRSLISESVGAVANTAGDIALNSGADLTLTAVDFNAGGEFVTTVTGTTYLLAAIDVEYHALVEHKDNGVIMTDIRSEDLTESATFNAIEAAGGVNFDINSQIILAGVRNPLIDSVQAGGWTADNEDSGRFNIADAYLGGSDENESDEDEANDDPHWREGGEWSEEGEFLVSQIALPTGVDGSEYAYLEGVLGRDSTINDPIELVSYSFYEKEQAISPAFKALLTIAVTQGMAGLEILQIAQGIGVSATNVALTTAVNTAASSFASTFVVEATAGVVSGDFDIGDIVGAASFSALTAGVTSGVNLDTFGGNWEGMAWAETAVGFGDGLTFANLVEKGIDATLTAGMTTAVYDDVEFIDSFTGSLKSSLVNLAMADLQTGIGANFAKGSAENVISHVALGCVVAEASGAACGAGVVGALTEQLYLEVVAGDAPDPGTLEYQAWKEGHTRDLTLVSATVGWVLSSGKAENVDAAQTYASSAFENNYLTTAQRERADKLLALRHELLAFLTVDCAGGRIQCPTRASLIDAINEAGFSDAGISVGLTNYFAVHQLVGTLDSAIAVLQQASLDNTNAMKASCSGEAMSDACRDKLTQAEDFLAWHNNDWFDGSRIMTVGSQTLHQNLEWGRDLDALIIAEMRAHEAGNQTFLEAQEAIIIEASSYDGAMNLVMGGVTVGGVVLTCWGTGGLGCGLAVAGGTIGQGDELIDGALTWVNGVPYENPMVATLVAAGADRDQAIMIESWLDAGAAVVELSGGVVIAVKGGARLGTTTLTGTRVSTDDILRSAGPDTLPQGWRTVDDAMGANRVDPPAGYQWVRDNDGGTHLQSARDGRIVRDGTPEFDTIRATNTGVTRVGDGPLPTGQQSLDPSEISFSQATVNRQTSDGMTHDELVSSMRRDGWQGDPVDVVNMPDGAPTSMDNRRLLAAREAGIPIEANVRNAGDALTPAEVGRFRVAGQPAPTNWGEAIQLRTQRQGGMQGVDPSWPDRFPNGSIYDPDFVGGQ